MHAMHLYDLNELLLHACFVLLARSAEGPKSSSDGLDIELKWIRSSWSWNMDDDAVFGVVVAFL